VESEYDASDGVQLGEALVTEMPKRETSVEDQVQLFVSTHQGVGETVKK